MSNDLPASFIIKKSTIALKIAFSSPDSVRIEPYQCKEENLRLAESIAKVQTAIAKLHLQAHKKALPQTLLLSFFDQKGWDVEIVQPGHES